MKSIRAEVEVGDPFDLRLTLVSLRRGSTDPTIRVGANNFVRASNTPDGPATGHYRHQGSKVLVEAWGPGANWLAGNAPALLGSRDDPDAFIPKHAVMRDLCRRMRGMRLGASRVAFDAMAASVIEQKVTGVQAKVSYAAVVKRYGFPAPGPHGLMVPPPAETMARLSYWELHLLGIERRRAETILRISSLRHRLESLVEMTPQAATALMTAIPGVGKWTAAEVCRVALGDLDAVSVGDYNLPNQVAWVLAGEPRGDDTRMLELLEPYAGQRARAIRLIEAGPRPPRFGPRRPINRIARI